jgi:hypothetical protein
MKDKNSLPGDAEFVDEATFKQAQSLPKDFSGDTVYGHNVRFWQDANGTTFYVFNTAVIMGMPADNPGMGCGRDTHELPWSGWHHYNTGQHCQGGSGPRYEIVRFERA